MQYLNMYHEMVCILCTKYLVWCELPLMRSFFEDVHAIFCHIVNLNTEKSKNTI